ncbi:MAG: hypothetical protein IJJ33_02980 [Victivallales bacterium]|nr:hypothetical protein [Victivallales bacterium]
MAVDLFYYLSTLPYLKPGDPPPMGSAEFLARCRASLAPDLADAVAQAALLPPTEGAGTETMRRWFAFETFLRNSAAAIRLARFQRSGLTFTPRDTDYLSPSLRKQVEDALALPSPAERENALDMVRWRHLDEMESGHSFDQTLLEIYALRLLLLEKQASRNLKEGKAAFASVLQDGLSQAQASRVDTEL